MAFHLALMFSLLLAAFAAAVGWLHRHRLLSTGFWATFLVTALAQFLPVCPLSWIELYLRRAYEPTWHRNTSLENAVISQVIGKTWPEWAFTLGGLTILAAAVYAWLRYYGGARFLKAFYLATIAALARQGQRPGRS